MRIDGGARYREVAHLSAMSGRAFAFRQVRPDRAVDWVRGTLPLDEADWTGSLADRRLRRAWRRNSRAKNPVFDTQDPPALHFGVNTDAMINGAACTLGYTGDILGPYFLQNFKETVLRRTRSRTADSRSSSAVTPTDRAAAARSPWSRIRARASSWWSPRAFSGSSKRTWSTAGFRSRPTSRSSTACKRVRTIDTGALADELPPFFAAVAGCGGLLQVRHQAPRRGDRAQLRRAAARLAR